jgi:signal transduction histidine kinase
MRPARWACCRAWARFAAAWLAALLLVAGPAGATVVEPSRADLIVSDQAEPPAPDDPRWQPVTLTHVERAPVAWYRMRFDADPAEPFWMLYLPFLYGGGQITLNGVPVADITQSSPTLYVRWERPFLLPLPAGALRAQGNVLLVRALAAHASANTMMGPQAALQPVFDRRLFTVRTLPMVTVATGLVVGSLVLLIWFLRRREVLYGLFGLAAILWALRTTTFVFDALPPTAWVAWRLLYFLGTGGFIVVMALFTLALARWSRPVFTRALLGYWALGPLAYFVGGHAFAGRWWVAGLIPVGLGLAVVAAAAAWRRRSAATLSLAVALALAVAAGLHDYAVAANAPLFATLLPGWTDHRLFLLHHAANLLLVVMGVLLAVRFVRTLGEVEAANRTLEARVKERERQIAASYERIAVLQREQAATDERQRIMRDLHDGLGSQLFTSLSRAERGALDPAAMSDTLRSAIDQMRVALEALASEEQDFGTAFGNFRFRWDARLRDCGLKPVWQVDLPDAMPAIAPHDALQILHIVQESLTNVVKHARASTVTVRLHHVDGVLSVDVVDDGVGAAAPARPAGSGGRGQSNMAKRAQRLGGTLVTEFGAHGGRVSLRMPLADAAASAA